MSTSKMKSITKRRPFRYADLYNAAFATKNLRRFVRQALVDFEREPMTRVRTPRYVHTLLSTQTIGQKASDERVPYRSVALMQFIERRAARLIGAHILEFLYRPGGWFHLSRLTDGLPALSTPLWSS